jgi:hypothetical protein
MNDWLSIALAVVGVVGIGGAIALFFLAPALLEVLITGAQKIFSAILATRLGCALIAAAIAWIAADQYRASVSAKECRARIEARDRAADAAAKKRDQDQSVYADADAKQRLGDLERQAQTDKDTIDALRQSDKACHPLTADQLR